MFSVIAIVLLVSLFAGIISIMLELRRPSRRYIGRSSVSNVYDAWTADLKMKIYWGNHLHAGFYGQPPKHKDFVQAKFDLIDELVSWGIAQTDPEFYERLENPKEPFAKVKILDVGCGVGGTALHLAQRWSESAHVTGITISNAQARYATDLARSFELSNVVFVECDAMDLAFEHQSFDIIWSLESEIHMPDKHRFMSETVRLLKPGGWFIMGTWNVRDSRLTPLSLAEKEHIQYLLDEWCHTKFDSIHDSEQLMKLLGLGAVTSKDWTSPTLPSWREAILVALRDTRGLT